MRHDCASRPHRRRGPRDWSHRYIRRQQYARRAGYQVRVPLDGSGQRRKTLGSWPSLREAQTARDLFLRAAGVRPDDPPKLVHWKIVRAAKPAAVEPDG